MDIAEEQLEKIRFTIEVRFREQLVRRAEFPFLQSMGLKDIFQGFTNPDGTYLGMLHLVWSSGTTWRSSWIDTHEEGEDLIRKIYRETENVYFDLIQNLIYLALEFRLDPLAPLLVKPNLKKFHKQRTKIPLWQQQNNHLSIY